MPALTSRSVAAGTRPTRPVNSRVSRVMSWETFTTDSCESPLAFLVRRTLPGASASRRFEATAAQIVVRIALPLNSFDCTMRTGRRNPGPEPAGSPMEGHQSSPQRITTSLSAGTGLEPPQAHDPVPIRPHWHRRLRQGAHAHRRISRSLLTPIAHSNKARCVTSCEASPTAPLLRKLHLESQ